MFVTTILYYGLYWVSK